VNQRDRQVLGEIYDCLNAVTGLAPLNPANVAVIAKAARDASLTAGYLMYSVECLRRGEHVEALEYTADARRALGLKPADERH
jgi:hypothetical protein